MYIDKFFDLIRVINPGLSRVRCGNESDGGYVVPDEICKKITRVYSFGVGDDLSFEADFTRKYPANVVCFDHTIDALPSGEWDFHGSCEFNKIGVGTGEDKMPLRDIRRKYMTSKEPTLAKFDIEYDEWNNVDYYGGYEVMIIELHIFTVENLKQQSKYFNFLYSEFYNSVNEELFKKYFFFLDALINSYFIFHAHGNNSLPKTLCRGYEFPPLLELTLVNRKYYTGKMEDVSVILPINGVDFPNKSDRPDFEHLFPFYNE